MAATSIGAMTMGCSSDEKTTSASDPGKDAGGVDATASFAVGGTVTGLRGSGLVLQNSGGDDLAIDSDGTFAFATKLPAGSTFAVTVKSQPNAPSQTCTVRGGSGTVATANVSSVVVSCESQRFAVGGVVTGLSGTGLVLQKNGRDDLRIDAAGAFTFSQPQDDGTEFSVTVKTAPTNPAQTCEVTGGKGRVAGGDVRSVNVNCSDQKFAIGGTISGLEGTGLVLQNNAGDDLPVNVNGTFAFAAPLEDRASYAVTVKSQPTNKWQTCAVTGGAGTVAAAPVKSIAVTCTTNTYAVVGTVSGLDGSGLVLRNNAGDDLTIEQGGRFEFPTKVESGARYLVSVLKNPTDRSQTCTVTNGTGTVTNQEVTNVEVSCATNTYTVGGTITGLTAAGLVLTNRGGDDNSPPSGAATFTFATAVASGSTYFVAVKARPPGVHCTVTNGFGTVTSANVSDVSVTCTDACRVVDGIRWCKDNQRGRSCNALCTDLGFGEPTISNIDWLEAQNTIPKCQRLGAAFGATTDHIATYVYACAHIYEDQIVCSTYGACPQGHRTYTDKQQLAVCPCQ